MKINDSSLIERTVELIKIISKLYSVILDDVGSTTHRSCSEVTMLSHLISCTSNDETRSSRDIESILAITTSTNNIDISVTIEDGRNTSLQNTITETEKFIYSHTAHLQTSKQGCNLFLRKLTLSNSQDDILGFFTGQLLVVQHSVQDILHFHNPVLLYIFILLFC